MRALFVIDYDCFLCAIGASCRFLSFLCKSPAVFDRKFFSTLFAAALKVNASREGLGVICDFEVLAAQAYRQMKVNQVTWLKAGDRDVIFPALVLQGCLSCATGP